MPNILTGCIYFSMSGSEQDRRVWDEGVEAEGQVHRGYSGLQEAFPLDHVVKTIPGRSLCKESTCSSEVFVCWALTAFRGRIVPPL